MPSVPPSSSLPSRATSPGRARSRHWTGPGAALTGALALLAACVGTVDEADHPCPCGDPAAYTCCNGRCVATSSLSPNACSDPSLDAGMKDGKLAPDAATADSASDPPDGADFDAPWDVTTADAPYDVTTADVPYDVASSDATLPDASARDGAADTDAACGQPPTFAPTGGVDPSDMSGCGLSPFTLGVAPEVDGGDAGSLDADASSDAATADESPGAPAIADGSSVADGPAYGGDAPGDSADDAEAGDATSGPYAGLGNLDPADTMLFVDSGEVLHAGTVIRPMSTAPPGVRDVQNGVGYRVVSGLAIFSFGSLTVPAGARLKVVGSLPVAIVSATTIRVDGVIEARAMDPTGAICPLGPAPTSVYAAPGATAVGGYAGGYGGYNDHYTGYAATAGGAPAGASGGGAGDMMLITGGSGGGHAGPGGRSLMVDGGVVPGGTVYDDQPLNAPHFHGGAGGGGGAGGVFARGGPGGAGGGAIRIVAGVSISIGEGASAAGVNASGCGGTNGQREDGVSAPGGGGAGGAIAIEAPSVTLGANAYLLAAGGAGGSSSGVFTSVVGAGPSLNVGDPFSTVQIGAPSGAFPSTTGNGSSASNPSGSAGQASPTGFAAGGGAGWIRVDAAGGNVGLFPGAIISPQASPAFATGTIAFVE